MRQILLFFLTLLIVFYAFSYVLAYPESEYGSGSEMGRQAQQLREGAKSDLKWYPVYLIGGAIAFYLILKFMGML